MQRRPSSNKKDNAAEQKRTRKILFVAVLLVIADIWRNLERRSLRLFQTEPAYNHLSPLLEGLRDS
jgi:hypothetical protein